MQQKKHLLLLLTLFFSQAFAMKVKTKPAQKVLVFMNFKSNINSLMQAARDGSLETCKSLISNGIDVNEKDGAGRTALLYAAGSGKKEVCAFLLEHGADRSIKDPKGRNALFHAATGGHAELCQYFKEIGCEITPDECTKLLPEAAKKGYAEVCRFLLENSAACDFEKLMTEIQGLLEPVPPLPDNRKRLVMVNQGWDNHIAYRSVTAEGRKEVILLLARCNQLISSIWANDFSSDAAHAQQLLAQGAILNARDERGRSPLLIALLKKNTALCDFFISSGASLHVQDRDHVTLVFAAARYGFQELCMSLISKGAPCDIKVEHELPGLLRFENGRTALFTAAEQGHLDLCTALISLGADVNASNNGRTPLIAAAAKGHADIVELLLSKGAQVNAQDAEGWTPLLSACIPSTGSTCSKKLDVRLITALIHAGAEVNVAAPTPWDTGWTPLMAAAIHGELGLCQVMLNRGADVTMCSVSPFPHTALEWAIIFGHFDVIKLLIERGSSLEAHEKPEDNALGLAKAVGLKEKNKEKFKPIILLIKEAMKNNTCAICFERQAENIVPCPGNHRTCSACWNSWAAQNKGCPFCRG